jgi:hypothetical protein
MEVVMPLLRTIMVGDKVWLRGMIISEPIPKVKSQIELIQTENRKNRI